MLVTGNIKGTKTPGRVGPLRKTGKRLHNQKETPHSKSMILGYRVHTTVVVSDPGPRWVRWGPVG